MEVLRTPDEAFAGVVGFDFEPHYLEIEGGPGDSPLRVHYLDEGPADAPDTVVLMHGEPSWCFLYRKVIPLLKAQGLRVIAPDLIGFGRSDKPAQRTDYTYERHVAWMRSALIDSLGLTNVTLVCQDWGGLIGLRLVAAHPERFNRVVAANTGLPTGDEKPSDAFLNWQQFSQQVDVMPIGAIVNFGTTTDLSAEVIAAYDAPFPEERFKEGARQFPLLVPTSPEDPSNASNRQAWEQLEKFDKPFLCAFSDSDPITKGADRQFRERVPGCRGQSHVTIVGGGHFLQEDRGEDLARAVTDFIRST
ncbi:MAG: haloalkane dehalogenase [Acidimicrobiales bacterium]|jgi:haloalkane dehalogenase